MQCNFLIAVRGKTYTKVAIFWGKQKSSKWPDLENEWVPVGRQNYAGIQNISTTVVLSDLSPNLAHSSCVDDHQSTCFKKNTGYNNAYIC